MPGYIQGLGEVDDKPIKLYDYQVRSLLDPSPLQHCTKSRQIGWSFTFAAEALAKSQLRKYYTGIFVSINDEESKEKIRAANILYESIPLAWKKRRTTDSKGSIEFDNGHNCRTRIVSHPQRPVRGKNADVFLDEMAHYQDQQAIYTSALPVISRGNNQLKIASSPLGKNTLFHSIAEDLDKYKEFKRYKIYWYNCPEFCSDTTAAAGEPENATERRVLKYGSDKIKLIFNSMDLEDFQQEYECSFSNEQTSYFPYELLGPCTKAPSELQTYKTFYDFLPNVKGELFAGFDLGRIKDNSELWILEKIGDRFHDRVLITMSKTEFDTQESVIWEALRALPIKRLAMDETGIGKQLAERTLKKFGKARIEPVTFTNEIKETMAINLHRIFEQQNFYFRHDRDIMQQFHSIKKSLLPGGKHRYDTTKNEKHHADKVWAAALAITAGINPGAGLQVRFI